LIRNAAAFARILPHFAFSMDEKDVLVQLYVTEAFILGWEGIGRKGGNIISW
jgi:hypothetical protein